MNAAQRAAVLDAEARARGSDAEVARLMDQIARAALAALDIVDKLPEIESAHGRRARRALDRAGSMLYTARLHARRAAERRRR